ncbi:MAG: anhydro-N-acetylmuramic acid kinase [Betaproteobacteria bacterium]|nr:anhydro-N-acetylmuramic acid kinase [Betaproteobacteria bacterium]
MSGTSLDGADAALVDFAGEAPRVLASCERPFSPAIRSRLERLCQPGTDGLDEAGACSLELADLYTEAVEGALRSAGVAHSKVTAIGCHGQTVRHRPELGFTLQLGDPARLAERTGIDVIADFRRRDMAAGGQGAPLVPAFHDMVFRRAGVSRAIVNIGGISNVTLLADHPVIGFDCGPGNRLMDGWIALHGAATYDEGGRWASTGRVNAALLDRMLADPYFTRPPPKSTGRERFNLDWVRERLPGEPAPQDVQATLLELTARSIVDAIDRHAAGTSEIYLCGGGAKNGRLVQRISELAAPKSLAPTDVLGVPAGQVEPVAFAWLARKFVDREPVDLGPITGARHPCVLGALYPA